MARIRSIKPEFPQSETIGALSRDARLLFIQLWTLVDDAGRARAASRMLASLLYPYDDDAPSLIEGWLAELERHGCVRRYEVEGSRYLEICNWLKHQKIDKPSASKLPPFGEASRSLAKPREASATDLGSRTMDLGSVGEATASLPQQAAGVSQRAPTQAELEREFAETFWPAVWKREDKLDALKAYVSARRKGGSPEAIMVGVAAYSAHVLTRERRYQKAPGVWLRAGGWESEYLPDNPRPANRNGGRNGGSTLDALDRFIELDRQQTEREMHQGQRALGHQATAGLLSTG